MSTGGDLIRLFGTAVGAVVGAFVPPAGVAIGVAANVGASIYDASQKDTTTATTPPPGTNGQTVLSGLATSLQTALSPIPGFKGASVATGKKTKTTAAKGAGASSVKVKTTPLDIGKPKKPPPSDDEESSDDEADDEADDEGGGTSSGESGDASDALIRSLRATGDTPPDTAALIADRDENTGVANIAID